MDSSSSVKDLKWKNLRHRSYGCLTVTLFHKKLKLNEDLATIAEDHQELHTLKEDLRQKIADLQRMESAVTGDKEHYGHTLQKLQQEVTANKTYCAENSIETDIPEMLRQNLWADVEIANGMKQIRQAEMDLRVWNTLITPTPAENNSNESNPKKRTSVMVELPNIDSFGLIEKNGSIQVNNKVKCCFCLKNDIDCVLYKCGHESCCFACINQPQNKKKGCPLCKMSIKKVVRPFRV